MGGGGRRAGGGKKSSCHSTKLGAKDAATKSTNATQAKYQQQFLVALASHVSCIACQLHRMGTLFKLFHILNAVHTANAAGPGYDQ